MQETTSSYRPHDPGHNYYRPGIYLITLVVRGRSDNASLFGSLNDNPNSTTAIDYTRTAVFRKEREGWVSQVMAGATVIVTPGISRGEQLMKDECLEKGFPLIHLQKEPIGPYWKPEKTRLDACCLGRLLILAPWKAEGLGDVNGVPSDKDYSVFHNLNALAQEICLFNGEARILRD